MAGQSKYQHIQHNSDRSCCGIYVTILVSFHSPKMLNNKQALQYNVPNGKKNRGLATVLAYKTLVPNEAELTPENVRLAHTLGWCVEMVSNLIISMRPRTANVNQLTSSILYLFLFARSIDLVSTTKIYLYLNAQQHNSSRIEQQQQNRSNQLIIAFQHNKCSIRIQIEGIFRQLQRLSCFERILLFSYERSCILSYCVCIVKSSQIVQHTSNALHDKCFHFNQHIDYIGCIRSAVDVHRTTTACLEMCEFAIAFVV